MLKHSSRWLLCWFAVVCGVHNVSAQPVPENGVLDARSFDFSSSRLNLSGTWNVYAHQLIEPGALAGRRPNFVTFPQIWNDHGDSGQGTATYSLAILVSDPGELAIDIPQVYSSYKLFINGELLAQNGVPGQDFQETVPQWLPQTIRFSVTSDTLELVLQIANFNHYKGGCKDPIYLSGASRMLSQQAISKTSKLVECATLFIVGLFFVAIYFQHGRKKVVVYFALLCFTWSVRCIFSNDYTFIQYFPTFNWTAMVRIEYITLYLTMMWAMLYLARIFTHEASPIIKYLLVTANGAFVAYTLYAAPVDFTRFLPVYLITSGIVLVYGAAVVLLALINDRQGANLLTVSIVLGLLTFSYDIFTYEGWFSYNSLLFSAAYIVIFTLMGLALLIKLGIVKSATKTTTILTYKDLYGDQK
jgi:hypothetical protein